MAFTWGAPSRTISQSRTTDIPLLNREVSSQGLLLTPGLLMAILNYMVQYKEARLNSSFSALSDATRRGVLEQLGIGDASITTLAKKFQMTLTGMKKHIDVLEQAGLVTTEKVGRVRTCKAGHRNLEEEAAWIDSYRKVWETRFVELDKVIEELKKERE